jgi:hypothetical protein
MGSDASLDRLHAYGPRLATRVGWGELLARLHCPLLPSREMHASASVVCVALRAVLWCRLAGPRVLCAVGLTVLCLNAGW